MIRYIYALICPLSKDIKYVGQTKRTLHKRLKSHIHEYSRNKKLVKFSTHKFNWMSKLEGQNLLNDIKIVLLEQCELDTVNEKEQYWITIHNDKGLVNSSPGGYVHSEETIEKIRLTKIGDKNPMYGQTFIMSDDTKQKISNSLKTSSVFQDMKNSVEYRNKVSLTQSVHPLYLLDKEFEIIEQFPNCQTCADYLGYKKANIKNAIRFHRPVGKWKHNLYWIVRKADMESAIDKIKTNSNNRKYFDDSEAI